MLKNLAIICLSPPFSRVGVPVIDYMQTPLPARGINQTPSLKRGGKNNTSLLLEKCIYIVCFLLLIPCISLAQSDTLKDSIATYPKRSKTTYFFSNKDPEYPRPKRAVWLSLALPGMGQIYNRRYWKVPIVYAALGTAGYFIVSNQMKYFQYKQAYVESRNPNDRQMREYHRRNRDLFIIIGTVAYTLTAIEAYVDAHLKNFKITDDLSMYTPTLYVHKSPVIAFSSAHIGIQLRFSIGKNK